MPAYVPVFAKYLWPDLPLGPTHLYALKLNFHLRIQNQARTIDRGIERRTGKKRLERPFQTIAGQRKGSNLSQKDLSSQVFVHVRCQRSHIWGRVQGPRWRKQNSNSQWSQDAVSVCDQSGWVTAEKEYHAYWNVWDHRKHWIVGGADWNQGDHSKNGNQDWRIHWYCCLKGINCTTR